MNRFENEVAVVTGGGSVIGAAIAIRLAEERVNGAIIELEAGRGQETVDAIGSAGWQSEVFARDVGGHEAIRQSFS
ncbi:SDR family NAD(P)-dependent oxidoreductase [Mariniblastus fucicola]|nr:SDR family NAD(P)-dependent oxidoreductase [Mariniblastus fucicola]